MWDSPSTASPTDAQQSERVIEIPKIEPDLRRKESQATIEG
jgi:hypothetical protein